MPAITPEIIEQLSEDFETGMSPEAAAARVGWTTMQLSRLMRAGEALTRIDVIYDEDNPEPPELMLYIALRKAMADGEAELIKQARLGGEKGRAAQWLLSHSPVYRQSYIKNEDITEDDLRKLIVKLKNRKTPSKKEEE